MISRPQSLESFRPLNKYNYAPQQYDMRKKIQNFTFLPTDKIGRGYSSTVYKGQNEITKQSVAIKVIELKSLKDQNTKKFLQNELECLRRLDHQNVLRYINSFMTSNNCYIITELYNGGDLAKMLKDQVFFGETQIYDIFNQFYQGYLHLNSRGFIHRDIKPSNILIQNKINDKNTYVIADFGFIKHLDQNPKDSFNVGTPVYMAPESITSNVYTVKSDIWSMGVMLFEMAYGLLPFQCKSESDLRRQICNKELRLQEVQESKQIFMSIEFKTLLLSCLRKNPQNRISLEEIGIHPWLKKFTIPSYDLGLRIQKTPEPIYRRPVVSFSRQKINSCDEDKNYGYIGNQAIKREKSLQANHFSLKNCQKSIKSFTRDCDISIERHREKARQLGIIGMKNTEKENQLKIKEPEPYFAQDYLKEKLTTNNRIQESPKMNFLIEKKNRIEPRSSLLEGMKGIVNIKNNHILKINHDSKSKNLQRIRQNYQRTQAFKTQFQASTSLEETKMDSAESTKNTKNLKVLETNIFQNLSPCQVNNFLSIKKQTKMNANNIENLPSYANSLHACHKLYDPIFTQPCIKHSPSPKKNISPKDFFLKSMHMLRFIFENLVVLSEFNDEKDRFNDVKKRLQEFFVGFLEKIKRSLINKENLFGLQRWDEFCQNDSYKTFVTVIEKYHEKYSESSVIGQIFNNFSHEKEKEFNVRKYQSLSYSLLKMAEEISSANKEMPKKSIRNSSSFNAWISLIFNLHKCVQLAIKFTESKKDLNLLLQISPQKDLQEMNSKSKDPFKIPKMVIQLKKKLITVESGTFNQGIQANEKQIIFPTQNVYKTGRVSLR